MSNINALSTTSALPTSHKRLVKKMIGVLELPNTEKVKDKIYKKFSPFLSDNGQWNVHWISNRSASNTKLEKEDTKFCNITLYNSNRVVSYTFIYFKCRHCKIINNRD